MQDLVLKLSLSRVYLLWKIYEKGSNAVIIASEHLPFQHFYGLTNISYCLRLTFEFLNNKSFFILWFSFLPF